MFTQAGFDRSTWGGLLLACTASLAGTAMADTFTIDSTNGTINGVPSGTINGVPFSFVGNITGGTIAKFRIDGDLVLLDVDTLTGTGSRGIQLLVANDVNIAPGAVLEFSAHGSAPGPGGGAGGALSDQVGFGGVINIFSGSGALGGAGGLGGFNGLAGFPSLPGLPGLIPIVYFAESNAGSNGINSPGSGAAGSSTFVANLLPGSPGGFGSFGGAGGSAGSAGCPGANGANGSSINAGDGFNWSGRPGEPGLPGSNAQLGFISGGGGGASGTGGEGGHSGGAGGGGSGGGGGGGGGLQFLCIPGAGGIGGAGGLGGFGGAGGNGGSGGAGGAGGGALSIIAKGRVTGGGSLLARGGAGQGASAGSIGAPGGAGAGGFVGTSGFNSLGACNCGNAHGGNAGNGAAGGTGDKGGDGGNGGSGGGGAGGTVKLLATAIQAPSADLDVLGGSCVSGSDCCVANGTPGCDDDLCEALVCASDPFCCDTTWDGICANEASLLCSNAGGDGRVLLGDNLVGLPDVGSIEGAAPIYIDGPRDLNPYIEAATMTPFIADLVGGAEVYGPTGLSPSDLPGVVSNAPPGAIAALARMDVGPAGYDDDYDGFDMLFVVNLAAEPIDDPSCGVGAPGFETALMTRGVAGDPDFGGTGPTTLSQLGTDQVWSTLVPAGIIADFNLSADGESATVPKLGPGETLYLGGSCPAADLNGDCEIDGADLGILLGSWGPCPKPCPPGCLADLNGDCNVGGADLGLLLGQWTP